MGATTEPRPLWDDVGVRRSGEPGGLWEVHPYCLLAVGEGKTPPPGPFYGLARAQFELAPEDVGADPRPTSLTRWSDV